MKSTYIPVKEKKFNCKFCSNEFTTRYSQKKFCTEKCQQLNEYKYTKPQRFCKICSISIKSGNSYCNEHKVRSKIKKLSCLHCHEDITNTGSNKYCKKCSLLLLKDKSAHYRKFANLLKEQWRSEGKSCVWCKSLDITVDHIIPFKKGGELMNLGNLQPMCHLCNISKGNKLAPYIECERYFIYVLNK